MTRCDGYGCEGCEGCIDVPAVSVTAFYCYGTAAGADGWAGEDGGPLAAGWYWVTESRGLESDPIGPFATRDDAFEAAVGGL